ncbi:MAG TPA: methylenetetrahydrofolate reductase [Tepidiformaceae bacterium]|nr:methylenetetrahydrofolate reductase [Tepidiformaceae bacterium]
MKNRDFPVALEITPPQKALTKVLLRRATLLGGAAQAVNVIQRPGRQSSLDASLDLRAAGIEPAWHLVTRGSSRAELHADLQRAREGGIPQVLCILGDHAAESGPDTPTIREAVTLAREYLPGAIVGATLNQYGRDQAAALRNLLPKLHAGASYIQTQPVFGLQALEPYARVVERDAPDTRIVAMAMPLLTLDAAERIEARIGIGLPAELKHILAAGDQEAAWGAFTATLRELAKCPFIDGVAIMTFEMDPPLEVGQRIVQSLVAAGVSKD